MSTRLFLIRHGATMLTAEDRFAGATDVELSDVGRAQAEALARRLADDTSRPFMPARSSARLRLRPSSADRMA
jgi:probable phosphoglycerate mutase